MVKGLVNKIIPFSSVDGPGNRTVVFLQGCNFNCLYCHNPETINICNNKCSNMSADEVFKQILKVKSFISGITVSGGECTLQYQFLTDLFKKVKDIGLTCFVDTNGSVPLYEKKELLDVMDMAMVDIKSFDSKEHTMLTGMDNNIVLENVKYLASINKLYELRTVIVPDILDNHYNVDNISKLIASLNSDIRYKLIKYRNKGVRTNIIKSNSPTDDMMNELYELALKNGCKNIVLV